MSIDYSALPFAKGSKGDAWVERRARRDAMAEYEDREKTKVRKRDLRCRWPHCANCLAHRPPLDVAHVCGAKGMGGDHGTRSSAQQMMLIDHVTHLATGGIEQHGKWVEPLTPEGTDGPCEFWQRDAHGRPFLVARELAPFIYERD